MDGESRPVENPLKNLSQGPDYKEERHKGCELPLISSKVQSRTRGENSTHYENLIYCLPSNEATKSI